MRERFQPLPHGPFRVSRAYQARVQAAVERASRFPLPAPFPGLAGSGPYGPFLAGDVEGIVWAELTAAPEDDFSGYSWRERWPGPDGTFAEPEAMMQGDNGSQDQNLAADALLAGRSSGEVTITTDGPHGFGVGNPVTVSLNASEFNGTFTIDSVTPTTFSYSQAGADHDPADVSGTATSAVTAPRSNPAFDPGGGDAFQVGDIVALARGYLHTGATDWADLGSVGGDPALGPQPDEDSQVGQEWLILGMAGGNPPTVRRIRISGRPYCVGGAKYHPGFIDVASPSGTLTFSDGTAVWVRQRYDAPLGTGGRHVVLGLRERASFAVMTSMDTSESRPLYVTKDRLWLTGVRCDPDTGELVSSYEDAYDGRCADSMPAFQYNVGANSMYLPGVGAPGLGGI